MTVELLPTECFLSLGEVARYVGKTPQTISAHKRLKLLKAEGRRVRLDNFCKYLAKVYPTLPRPTTAEQLDAWRANNS